MKINRIFQRSLFYTLKFGLVFISYFNHRLYMKLYVPLLKKNGMNINGTPRYIAKNVSFDDFNKITLSERDVISGDVRFLTHDYSYTTALIAKGNNLERDIAITKPIKVGRNVFIGARSFILPGTNIGNNCIIGAGSVVRGNIPSGSVVIGNPCAIIFSIDRLADKWENLSDENIRKD